MNIFILSIDPTTCAAYHCDRHVSKMAVEYTQLLANDLWKTGFIDPADVEYETNFDLAKHQATQTAYYKGMRIPKELVGGMANHPAARWLTEEHNNETKLRKYAWLTQLAVALCEEKVYRWPCNGVHQYVPFLQYFLAYQVNQRSTFTYPRDEDFIQIMPKEFQDPADTVTAYRRYYRMCKGSIATYRHRPIPDFMKGVTKDSYFADSLL